MENEFITLDNGSLRLEVCRPGCYYRGTRFDWAGAFRRVVFRGVPYCDEWFDAKTEDCHDHICGPSEEFSAVGYEDPSLVEVFLKPGVGLLRREGALHPYDRFHTYEIADGGEWSLDAEREKVVFSHRMPLWYDYQKTVALKGSNVFEIRHRFVNTSPSPMRINQYNHNFFTFGLDNVGVERRVDWGFDVDAVRREDSVNIDRCGRSIWITAPMCPGQKAFFGNLHSVEDQGGGYSFVLASGGKTVSVKASEPMGDSVLWTNDRVFCPEPYIYLDFAPAKVVEWSVEYTLNNEDN